MMYGMSYDDYWHGSADMLYAYRTSFIIKERYETQKNNSIAWLNGLYNQMAIASCLDSREGADRLQYYDRPIDFEKDQKELELKRQREIEEAKIKAMAIKAKNILNKQKNSK